MSLVHSGTIPDSWWTKRNLQNINLAHNRITGTIPSYAFKNLPDLMYLRLENNRHLLRGIRPNFTLAWIDFDDVVVEEKFVVGNKLQANST